MYAGARGPSDEELERYGLAREDVQDAEEIVDIYPDNWPAFELFAALGTQWRIGMSGASGLDYAVLPQVMRLCGVKKRDQAERFDELRLMERAALDAMAEGREHG